MLQSVLKDVQLSHQTPCQVTLDLVVNNHPGVMSHICGLFSRRACNVEGILCMPIGQGEHRRIWLLVNKDRRLEQMIEQVRKLQDVLDVQCRNVDREVFLQVEKIMQ